MSVASPRAAAGREIKVLLVTFEIAMTPCCAIDAPDQLSKCEWVTFYILFFVFVVILMFYFLLLSE